jgi:hypothetical protein
MFLHSLATWVLPGDPNTPPGFDAPIGDIARVADAFYEKFGPLPTDWRALAGSGWVFTAGANGIANAADTRFLTPGYNQATAGTVAIETAIPFACSARNLFVRQNGAPGAANGNIVSYRLRVEGVDTALRVDRAANAGIGISSNTTDIVALAQGAVFSLVAVKTADLGNSTLQPIVSVEFF